MNIMGTEPVNKSLEELLYQHKWDEIRRPRQGVPAADELPGQINR